MVQQNAPCIYEFGTTRDYLLDCIFPQAVRIPARIGESAEDVLAAVPSNARVFAFHLNLTETDLMPVGRELLRDALARGGMFVINGAGASIGKRRLQRALVQLGMPDVRARADGDPEQRVIVKTDLNFGGDLERRLSEFERRFLDVVEPPADLSGSSSYRIVKRKDVPLHAWHSQGVVVERYIENKHHGFCRAYLLGSRVAISHVRDPAPLKKMPIDIPRETKFFDISHAARERRAQSDTTGQLAQDLALLAAFMGLNFAAIDIVQDDAGRSYVVDVNATPYWGAGGHAEIISFLAEALERPILSRSAEHSR